MCRCLVRRGHDPSVSPDSDGTWKQDDVSSSGDAMRLERLQSATDVRARYARTCSKGSLGSAGDTGPLVDLYAGSCLGTSGYPIASMIDFFSK